MHLLCDMKDEMNQEPLLPGASAFLVWMHFVPPHQTPGEADDLYSGQSFIMDRFYQISGASRY